MPKDLDIKRRAKTPTPVKTTKLEQSPAAKTSRWSVILITIVVLLVVLVFVYLFIQSVETVGKTKLPSSKLTNLNPLSVDSTAAASSPADSNSTSPIIDIYDSGAGSEAVKNTISLLTANNYSAQDLNQSQAQYDQTYIWYQPSYAATAQTIAKLLGNRKVSLNQTQITGSFNILIYLGKS